MIGAFWGMRREVYWELGGLDERFAGYGCEELDFQFRAQVAHYRLALARVDVRHELHATFETLYSAQALEALEMRNRQRFAQKHGRPILAHGIWLEPFASQGRVEETVVIAARNEAAALRVTLDAAAADAGCRAGRVQVVVVDEGSEDETAEVLEEYRGRLGPGLTVIRLEEAVGRARAQALGKARAIGPRVRLLAPGDGLESPSVRNRPIRQRG
jgi:GT2 family glycosyltransferase